MRVPVWLRASEADLPDDWREQVARCNLPSPGPLPQEGEPRQTRRIVRRCRILLCDGSVSWRRVRPVADCGFYLGERD